MQSDKKMAILITAILLISAFALVVPVSAVSVVNVEVGKTVWNGTAWVKELNAGINDTLRFNCTIRNSGTSNFTQIRFWDILDCSLVFAGNATLKIPSHGIEEVIDLEKTPIQKQPYNFTFKQRVLHPNSSCDSGGSTIPGSLWDPYDPVPSTKENCTPVFHELCPEEGKVHYLHGWEDTYNDGRVSACDQLWLESYEEWYHVEEVPYTLNVTNISTGESKYIDSVLDYEAVNLTNPNGTEWNEVGWIEACCCKDSYSLENWTDGSEDGNLSAGDTLWLHNQRTGEKAQYSVDEVTKDLVVSMEWEIDHLLPSASPETSAFMVSGPITGPPDPENMLWLEPGQSVTIEYNATVVTCGVDINIFNAKGRTGVIETPPGVWNYGNEDVVTITVPCQSGDATDPTGFVKNEYTTTEDVYAKGSGFNASYNGTMDIYIFNDYTWTEGLDISTLPEPYASLRNVSIDAEGNVGPVKIWEKEDTVIGEYDMFFDANGNRIYEPLIDAVDNPHDPGFYILGKVPTLTPIGFIALIGLLSVIAAVTIVRKRR
jgi:uncharacterized repeat protein (TIGR01451 family)